MKKVGIFLICGLLTLPAWADYSLDPLLNKVSLRLKAETWVTTKTALVNIAINAAITDQAVEKIQTEVMQKLNQLVSNVNWHIVSFDRQQDKSGLETIQIMAQARLAQTDLGNLRDKAKSISKPGVTYTVDSVQFVPSKEEIDVANVLLRNNIYQQAKAEIDILNTTYPNQKYYLHQIDFGMLPMPMADGMAMKQMAAGENYQRQPLSVGDKQELQAFVVLASMTDQLAQKINAKP